MAGKRTWTDEQSLAINTRDRTLLISAAAGAGKTATLTERIIRSLLDEEKPENINEMLIVTFTKAAVAELRERIGKALRDAVLANPDNPRLRAQLALLPGAKIQTIDSFCVDILRKNCDRVGVSPAFRIPDEAEARLLAISTVERLIDQVYDGFLPEVASPEDFEELADGLTDTRGMSELSDVLLKLYDEFVNVEEGVDALRAIAEQYNLADGGSIEGSKVFAFAITRLHEMAAHYSALYRKTLAKLNPETDKAGKHAEMCCAEIDYLTRIIEAKSYSVCHELLCRTERAPKTTRRGASEEGRFVVSIREALDEDIKHFNEKIFFMPESEITSLFAGLYRRVSVLYRFLAHFDRVFMAEKRRLAICEFSDISRYAYICLWDGAPTETARSEAERYSSIYIDEYQDVNGIQNRIFEAISRPDNRFMVGDIKQSIYGFRGARPEFFAEMKKSFPELKDSGPGGSASIFMSKNFRSESPVIDFVNEVFDKLFDLTRDSIGYRDGDRLVCGKAEHRREPFPEVHVLPKVTGDHSGEPRFVADRIAELTAGETKISGAPITAADVAILLRSDKGRVAEFATALTDKNIPAKLPDDKNFFLSAEILLAISLLTAVDNPRKDVYLASLMRSPLFDFSLDELIIIRRGAPSATSLYDALLAYLEENPEYTKGRDFVDTLQKYRRLAEGQPVDRVIARLYRETGLTSLASDAARANLDLFYEYARSFEASSFKGLYNFIRYLGNVINRDMSLDEKQDAYTEDTVKIITAHKSKGLEFPVVFLADAAKNMSKRDTGRLYYADSFACSMSVRTDSGLALLENPVNNVIADYNARLDFEEELRVLYVALTRAVERLYVVGTSPSVDAEKFMNSIEFLKETLTPYSVYKLPSYLAAIMVSGGLCSRLVWEEMPASEEQTEDEKSDEACTEDKCEETDLPEEASFTEDELLARFDFEYPDVSLTKLPRKLSVSGLHPTVLDGSEEEPIRIFIDADREEKPHGDLGKKPKFMLDTDPDDSAKRGIATHLFMQFCDLENLAKNGSQAELDRLVLGEFISREDAARVRLDEIELFARSGLIEEMRGAKKIYRELRFNVRFPASRFTADAEKREAYADRTLLVQGVIDCIVERESGELLLIDYKTDRLTKRELENRALATEKLTRSHASQLSYYRMAVEKMFGRPPVSVAVYSLPLGDTVEIKIAEM
ncbi:MAG: UvrD-helicase domain-containing protein [Clostridia bacterium]|nr:UvrD-helicase domain-containing protein [Clostridia bacterium]